MSNRKFSPARVAQTPAFIPLEAIRVASPCHADWDAMSGDARARFCGSCQKNVYNLSEMTRLEAEALIREKEGNLCVRYYQRADGTILTQDCPIGILQADPRLGGQMAVASYFTALLSLCAALLSGAVVAPAAPATAGAPRMAPAGKAVTLGRPAPPSQSAVTMGEPCPATAAHTMGVVAPSKSRKKARPKATPQPTATPRPLRGRFVAPSTDSQSKKAKKSQAKKRSGR